MILFSTTDTQHLAYNIAAEHGKFTFKKFNDGELFVRIDTDVCNRDVWVVASTQPPAQNLLELFLLLDALQAAGAQINLFITYFAYARQIQPAENEARAAAMISSFLQRFTCKSIAILHPHSPLLHKLLPFRAVYDLPFFCARTETYDAIAAPDKGAYAFAQEVARICQKDLILLAKRRPEHEHVEISLGEGSAFNKRILLVDDIISTGRTLVYAADLLKSLGASSVAAAATHGVFAPGAHEFLGKSILEKIMVTNSIAQISSSKVEVFDICATIATYMRNHS